jgi:sodium/potassium-transporting ATPase subunit alpha
MASKDPDVDPDATNLGRGRIQYADDVEAGIRRRSLQRRMSIDSVRSASRQVIDPAMAIPIEYRTVFVLKALLTSCNWLCTSSFGIEESQAKALTKSKAATEAALGIEDGPYYLDWPVGSCILTADSTAFAKLDWHSITVDELNERLSTGPEGLTNDLAAIKLKEVGRNVLSAPPSRWFIKTLTYLFGGFGTILFVASILVFISWKPLGQPPSVANLALGIVLVLVWVIQALFSFFQGLFRLTRQ